MILIFQVSHGSYHVSHPYVMAISHMKLLIVLIYAIWFNLIFLFILESLSKQQLYKSKDEFCPFWGPLKSPEHTLEVFQKCLSK